MKKKINKTIKVFKDLDPVSFYQLCTGVLAGAMLLSHGFVIKLLGVVLFLYILYVEGKE